MEGKEELIRTWIGQKKEKIMYPKVMNGGFNIFAFLFRDIYFLYRKMYIETLIIFLATIVINYILELIKIQNSIIISIIYAIVGGFIFYPLYKRNILRKIQKYESRGLSYEEQLAMAKKHGGAGITVLLLVLIPIIIIIACLVISFMTLVYNGAKDAVNDSTDYSNENQYTTDEFDNNGTYSKDGFSLNYDKNIWKIQKEFNGKTIFQYKDTKNCMIYSGMLKEDEINESEIVNMIDSYEEEVIDYLESENDRLELESLDYFRNKNGILILEAEGELSDSDVTMYLAIKGDKQYVFVVAKYDTSALLELDAEDVIQTMKF